MLNIFNTPISAIIDSQNIWKQFDTHTQLLYDEFCSRNRVENSNGQDVRTQHTHTCIMHTIGRCIFAHEWSRAKNTKSTEYACVAQTRACFRVYCCTLHGLRAMAKHCFELHIPKIHESCFVLYSIQFGVCFLFVCVFVFGNFWICFYFILFWAEWKW